LKELGIKQIRFADTVGVLTPMKCGELIKDFSSHTGIETEIQAHNDLGLAAANSIMAQNQAQCILIPQFSELVKERKTANLRKLIHASTDF
jgi:homocitrate synthase NifV